MMGLDVLRGKTPHKMRLELLVGLLAYNLVRLMMLNSASLAGVSPRAISFTACLSYLASSWNRVHWMPLSVWQSQIEVNLLELAKHRVGHRQGRLEPRQLKRRLKAYNQLPPRADARKYSSKIDINNDNTCGCDCRLEPTNNAPAIMAATSLFVIFKILPFMSFDILRLVLTFVFPLVSLLMAPDNCAGRSIAFLKET